MDTPRFRFTVMPLLVALTTALMALPATLVVKVAQRGMGFEHEQPWRTSSPVESARETSAINGRQPILLRLLGLRRHALFAPTALAALSVAIGYLVDPSAFYALPVVIGATLTEGVHPGEFLAWESNSLFRESVTVLSGQTLLSGAVVGRVKFGIGRVSIPTVVGTGTGTASLVFAGPEVEVGNYVLTCITAVAHGGVFSLTTPSGKALPNFTMTPGSTNTTAYTSRHINFSITDATDFIVGDVFTFVVSTTAPTVIGGTGTGVLTALTLGPDAMPGRYKIVNDVVVANGGDMSVIGPDGNNVGGRFIWSASGATATFTSRQISFTISDATDYIAGNFFDVAVFNQLAGGKVVAWDPTTFDGRHRAYGVLYAAVDAAAGDLPGVLIAHDAIVQKDALQWAAAITSSQKESAYLDLAARRVVARDSVV